MNSHETIVNTPRFPTAHSWLPPHSCFTPPICFQGPYDVQKVSLVENYAPVFMFKPCQKAGRRRNRHCPLPGNHVTSAFHHPCRERTEDIRPSCRRASSWTRHCSHVRSLLFNHASTRDPSSLLATSITPFRQSAAGQDTVFCPTAVQHIVCLSDLHPSSIPSTSFTSFNPARSGGMSS